MDITTPLWRLYRDYFIHELGLNEFENNLQLTFGNREFAYTHKMQTYDADTEKCTNEIIFRGVVLDNPIADKLFKRAFVNRFANRQISSQTSDRFAQIMVSILMGRKDAINFFITNFDEFASGGSTTTNNGNKTSDGRGITQNLPQLNINFDLDNHIFKTGTVGSGARSKEIDTSTSSTQNFDIETLSKVADFIDEQLNYFEKGFLQTW